MDCFSRPLLAATLSLALAACTPATSGVPPKTRPAARTTLGIQDPFRAPVTALAATLDSGDTHAAFGALCRLYAAAGVPTARTLSIRLQAWNKPLSSYLSGDNTVRMSALLKAGQGQPYWQGWSRLLTGGTWQPAGLDETTRRRLGNFAVIGILAHEIGHHLIEFYGAMGSGGPLNELYADMLAVALMNQLQRDPLLAKYRALYARHIAGGLLDSVAPVHRPVPPPAAARDLAPWATKIPLPSSTAPYVALQLTRQRHLLGLRPGLRLTGVGKRMLLSAWAERLTKRPLVGAARVRTVGPMPYAPLEPWTAKGLTTDGALCGVKIRGDAAELHCTRGGPLQRRARFQTKLRNVLRAAFHTTKRFYLLTGHGTQLTIHRLTVTAGRVQSVALAAIAVPAGARLYPRLAVAPDGVVYLGYQQRVKYNVTQRILRIDPASGAPKTLYQPKFAFESDPPNGPLGAFNLRAVELAGDAKGTLFLMSLNGLRVLRRGRIATLAGLRKDYADCAGSCAAFNALELVAAQQDGSILVLDERGSAPKKRYTLRRVTFTGLE